ncbi:MAG: hypothetical protein IPL47_08995 [Phyllobacteriaceae bacterium]|nr:hypothetical protein [Phyllobacteriaceae bacterium]
MDGLDPLHDDLGLPADAVAIAMLPGTREDAAANAADLLDAAAAIRPAGVDPTRLRFVFAAHDRLDFAAVASRATGWSRTADGERLTLVAPDGAHALVVRGRFNETLAAASLVIGMAGTANEQAIGLGLPLIAVPSAGVQGENYVRMKARYFGDAAVTVAREPAAIAAAVEAILSDPAKRARMAAAGRERMGGPGASAAIAAEVRRRLEAQKP